MTIELGPFAEFIDSRVWGAGWYPELANLPVFAPLFAGQRLSSIDFEPLPDHVFMSLFDEARDYAIASVAGRNLPVHTAEAHFDDVVKYGLAQFRVTYPDCETNPFHKFVYQLLAIGLILHDCHHTGSTFLFEALDPSWVPDGNVHVAMEWVSATRAVEFLQSRLQSPFGLLLVACIILYTTFGGTAAKAKGIHNIPIVEDEHYTLPIFCIVRTSDVQPPAAVVQSIDKGLKLAFWEHPGFPVDRSYSAFIEDQLRFFDYVLKCYNALEQAVNYDVAGILGWRELLGNYISLFRAIQNGHRPEWENYIRAQLASKPYYIYD